MPSSWTQNIYHAVFSTKHRLPIVTPELETRLHPFVGGILKDLRCIPIAINGTADHLHFLAIYPSDLSNADMLRHVKKRSSEWVHKSFDDQHGFAWQEGYGGFTVSKSAMDDVAAYIHRQKEHHQEFDSLMEFKELLRKHGVEYDPKYLE
ncbi:MAG TPA: IS200/IS605 family transposase [Phycisphaerales bacterium]|nr:IS200/IS605 family transposase [Phycisphaerales bacterium]